MKFTIALLVISTAFAVFFAARSANPSAVSPRPAITKASRHVPTSDLPFWNAAVVAESENFREPTAVLPTADIVAVDHAAEVERLLESGDEQSLNFAIAVWFDCDPLAAREWLARCESLERCQTAMAMIATKAAQDGNPDGALDWIQLLQPGPQRDQALFDVYAFALRYRHFSEEQIRAAPLPEDRIAILLNGAAGD